MLARVGRVEERPRKARASAAKFVRTSVGYANATE
jgi:hypothetical protein